MPPLLLFAKDENEQRRLFDLGYEQGKKFIEALRNGKVESEDVNSTVSRVDPKSGRPKCRFHSWARMGRRSPRGD